MRLRNCPRVVKLLSRSPTQTRRVGCALGRVARPGQSFLLVGEYGSGKTQLVKGMANSLGVKHAARAVTSPTFVLHNMHAGRLILHHIDAHRLRSLRDFEALGWPDAFARGVTVVEWAERVFPNCATLLGARQGKRLRASSETRDCHSEPAGEESPTPKVQEILRFAQNDTCRVLSDGPNDAPAARESESRFLPVSAASLSRLTQYVGRSGKGQRPRTEAKDTVIVLLQHAGPTARTITVARMNLCIRLV